MTETLSTFVESGVCNTISKVHHHYLRDLSKSRLPSPFVETLGGRRIGTKQDYQWNNEQRRGRTGSHRRSGTGGACRRGC
ncbi:hypothetical protein HanPSC8_Chr03g0106391 [Helianthus annuus]|nr:hypothetical protein HanPSC8_Chr03g0106391 [Helianthus annuus]